MRKEPTETALRLAFKAAGMSVREFNRNSAFGKDSFKRLLQDLRSKQMTIKYQESIGRLIKISFRVGVVIRVPSEGIMFLEVGRHYPNGKQVSTKECWTVSGTRPEGEEMTKTVIREVREETGYLLSEDDFNFDLLNIHQYDMPDRESRVYFRILSRVWTQVFTADLDQRPIDRKGRPWRNVMAFEDNGVVIKVKAYPIDDLSELIIERMTRK